MPRFPALVFGIPLALAIVLLVVQREKYSSDKILYVHSEQSVSDINSNSLPETRSRQDFPASLAGSPGIIDGDTVYILEYKVRLFGIDAPERDQNCLRRGRPYACGQEAARWVEGAVVNREVTCVPRGVDRYRRLIAVCYVDGIDLGDAIVRNGWAVAYRRFSDRYVEAEIEARSHRRGLWAGEFSDPEEWRQQGTP